MSIQSKLFESSRQARQRQQWKIANRNLRLLCLILTILVIPTLVLRQMLVTHEYERQLWTLVNVAIAGDFLLCFRAWKREQYEEMA